MKQSDSQHLSAENFNNTRKLVNIDEYVKRNAYSIKSLENNYNKLLEEAGIKSAASYEFKPKKVLSESSIIAALKQVKDELIYNYVTNSFGDKDEKIINIENILRHSLKKDSKSHPRNSFKSIRDRLEDYQQDIVACRNVRNILIIGAGASHDAYPEIPLGKQIIEKFHEKFINPHSQVKYSNDLFNVWKEELMTENQFGLDFENFLSLLTTHIVHQKTLREELTKLLGVRHAPNLFYEIIAHMLKHSFFDAVISYNFDELLDQSIEEELCNQNYKYVLSDGHCVNLEELLVDGRLKTPIFIKPHGTHSHKSSLRFTKRHYFDLPSDIENMMVQLIEGYRGEEYGENKINKVNLFVVGFNLESIELNKIINKYLPGESTIFHFGYGVEDYKPLSWQISNKHSFESFFTRARQSGRLKHEAYRFIPIQFFANNKTNNQTGALSELFSVIWRNIHDEFNESYLPRSIGRHEIISYLFQKSSQNQQKDINPLFEDFDKNRKYFRDRTLVEIALKLVRGNGIIDIVETLNEDRRIGYFYKQFRKLCRDVKPEEEKKHTFYELLNEFTGDSNAEDIYGKNEFLYTYNIFRLTPIDFGGPDESWKDKIKKAWRKVHYGSEDAKHNANGNSNKKIEDSLIAYFESFSYDKAHNINLTILFRLLTSKLISKEFKINLYNHFDHHLKNGFTTESPQDEQKYTLLFELFRLFTKSAGSHYYFIQPNYSDPKNYMWESYSRKKLIHTNLALIYEVQRIFINRKWDILFCVLEAGEIIPKTLSYLALYRKATSAMEDLCQDIENGKRKLVLICSYDAVKQMHLKHLDHSGDTSELDQLISIHKNYIINSIKSKKENSTSVLTWAPKAVEILFLPSGQHNHHSMIFANFGTTKVLDPTHSFVIDADKLCKGSTSLKSKIISVGAIYMYRRGFSYSIAPIYIGVDLAEKASTAIVNDFKKILSLFFTYYVRSIEFHWNSIIKKHKGEDPTTPVIKGWLSRPFAPVVKKLFSSSNDFYENKDFCKTYKKFIQKIFYILSRNKD